MSELDRAPRLYRFIRWSCPRLLNPRFSMDVQGAEHLPPDGTPIILASNHLSFIDSIVLPLNIARPVYFLGKADYWDSWKTRWFFQSTGVIPIKRAGGDASRGALETGLEILGRGEVLGIYPEGTRSPDGRLYRGKTGPVRIALEAGVPIIPCAVIGTDQAMPTGSYLPKKHHVKVRYGKPLDLSRYRDKMDDPFVLRSATDELMFEIMMLSGQEYVDEYASKVKSGDVKIDATGDAERRRTEVKRAG